VPANDPLSAEFAKNLPQGQKLDPGNVEGDAMLNTFVNDNSIARNAKTQVWDSNLFPSGQDPDIDEGIANPFGDANNTSLEYIRKASLSRINDEVGNKTTSAILANYRNSFRRNYTNRLQDLGWLNQAVNPEGGLGVGGQDRINVPARRNRGVPRGNGGGGGGGDSGGGPPGGGQLENAFENTNYNSVSNHIAVWNFNLSPQQSSEALVNQSDPSFNTTSTSLYDLSNNDDDTQFVTTGQQIFRGAADIFMSGMAALSSAYYGSGGNSSSSTPQSSRSRSQTFGTPASEYNLSRDFSSIDTESSSSASPYGDFTRSFDSGGSPSAGGGASAPTPPKRREESFEALPLWFKGFLDSDDGTESGLGAQFLDLQQAFGSDRAFEILASEAEQTIQNKQRMRQDIFEAQKRSEQGIAQIELIKGKFMSLVEQVKKPSV
jgi:hypothetical protein